LSRRILFVVETLFPLGNAYQLKILAEGLSTEHDVCICVTGSTSPKGPSSFTSSDIPIHFLFSDKKLENRGGASRIQVALRLRKRIRAFKPDLVHALGQHATGVAASVLITHPETKLFSSILSSWLPQTTLVEFFERFIVNRVDQFLVVHPSLKENLLAFDAAENKFSVVNNGVARYGVEGSDEDIDRQRQRGRDLLINATGIPPSAFIAVTSADLEPATRLKDLIWATDLLSCVRDDVHLVILGEGSQHERLLRFAGCTLAADHIHFAGRPSAALQMLGGADVYWNSHLQTPLPSGLMAAMNFGVPVISVYGPETQRMIRHQETGFAVNFGARDEFARWTKFLIEKPDAAKQLALQGQQHVQNEFDAAGIVSDVEKLYEIELGH